jgi:hypothetical protein
LFSFVTCIDVLFLNRQDYHALTGCLAVLFSVRMKGLEPPRLAALDPKSSASANSATSAKKSGAKVFKKNYKSEYNHKNPAIIYMWKHTLLT